MAGRSRTEAVVLVAAVLLLVATGYELAVALKAIELGRSSGEGPRGSGFADLAALLGLLAGIVVTAVMTLRNSTPTRLIALLPLAAAAVMTATYYSFDPYYAPDRRRYSDGGLVAHGWIYGLCSVLVVSTVLLALRPRRWVGLLPILLFLTLGTIFLEGAGH